MYPGTNWLLAVFAGGLDRLQPERVELGEPLLEEVDPEVDVVEGAVLQYQQVRAGGPVQGVLGQKVLTKRSKEKF